MSQRSSSQYDQIKYNRRGDSKDVEMTEAKQVVSNLLVQMQSGYNFCTQIVTSLFNMANVVSGINAQNAFALENSVCAKDKALKAENGNCFEQLQDNVTQGQFAQENTNASFSLATSAQMQAQAAQNFANASFAIRQRIVDVVERAADFSSEEVFGILSQAENLSSSVQAVADSAQNYYYSMQNWTEKAQEKASLIYQNINDISNVLEA